MDITFHYPPDLLQLLVETLPRLCKAKRDLLLFLQGAGVAKTILEPYERMLQNDKQSFSKFKVAREVLTKLNEQGEGSLRSRREIIKRVAEFEDFTTCWESDRLAAAGLVARVRELVSTKDSFTRMRMEKDEERRKRLEKERSVASEQQARLARRDSAKAELYALFGEKDPHRRGKALEHVLNELFASHDIAVCEAFMVVGPSAEGVVEQIDGLVGLDGHVYLVEAKWLSRPVGVDTIAMHLVRAFNRGGQARGLVISYTHFTEPAIVQCREALARGVVVVLSTLREIVTLLESGGDLKTWLRTKAKAAIVDKQPYLEVTE